MRTDHYLGLIRRERDGWAAYLGVGSTIEAVAPPLPICAVCGVRHSSRREVQRLHGTQARRALPSAVYPSSQHALGALMAVLGPRYLRAQARARLAGDPVPPLLIVVGEGNAWDAIEDALDAFDELGHLDRDRQ